MSIEILYDSEEEKAVLYCNTTGTAFGPIIEGFSRDVADAFIRFARWCHNSKDLRLIQPLQLKATYCLFEKLNLASEADEIWQTDDIGDYLIAAGYYDAEKEDFIDPSA